MNPAYHDYLKEVCETTGQRLRVLARSRCSGVISEETFVKLVLNIEDSLTPAGFTLTASHTLDEWTVFKIWSKGCEESSASFEFLPATGEFRTVSKDGDSTSADGAGTADELGGGPSE